jgi:hypothetical protein
VHVPRTLERGACIVDDEEVLIEAWHLDRNGPPLAERLRLSLDRRNEGGESLEPICDPLLAVRNMEMGVPVRVLVGVLVIIRRCLNGQHKLSQFLPLCMGG